MTSCSPHLVFLLLLSLVCASCSFRKNEAVKNIDSSNFELNSVSVTRTETVRDSVWSLPTSRIYYVKAKAVDKATAKARIGETFSFAKGDSREDFVSDSEGNVYWREKFDFKYLAPENVVAVAREIHSDIGGDYRLDLAVDPWKEGTSGLAEIRTMKESIATIVPTEKAEAALRGQGEFAVERSLAPEKSNVIVKQAGAELLPDGVKLTLEAKFLRQGLERRLESPGVINSGKFNLKIKVSQNTDGKRFSSVANSGFVGAEVKDGQITSMIAINIALDRNSERVVEVSLDPLPNEVGLLPSRHWIYFSKNSATASGAPFTETLEVGKGILPDAARTKPTLDLSDWKIKRIGEGAFDAKRWEIAVEAQGRACPVDVQAIDKNPVPVQKDAKFKVQISSTPLFTAAAKIAKVNSDGCLAWPHEFSDVYSESEDRFDRYILVEGLEQGYAGQTVVKKVAVNPRAKDAAGFFIDVEKFGAPKRNPKPGKSVITIADYKVETPPWTFLLDRFIQLTQVRPYFLIFTPRLARSHTFATGEQVGEKGDLLKSDTKLRVRGYWLSQGIHPENDKHLSVVEGIPAGQYVADFESEVTVGPQGPVRVPAKLINQFTDIPLVESQMSFVLAVEPVGDANVPDAVAFHSDLFEKQDGLKPLTKVTVAELTKKMTPSAEMLKTSEYPNEKLMAHSLKDPWTDLTVATTDFYLDTQEQLGAISKATRVSLDEPMGKGWLDWDGWAKGNAVDLRAMLKRSSRQIRETDLAADPEMKLERLCEIVYPQKSEACEKDPKHHLVVTAFTATEKIEAVEREALHFPVISLNAIFSKEILSSERNSKVDREGALFTDTQSGSFSWEFGPFKSGVGRQKESGERFEHHWMKEIAVTEQVRSGLSDVKSISLRTEERKIKFRATLKNCLVISTREKTRTTMVFCSEEKDEPVDETWYSMREQRGNGTGSGSSDNGNLFDRGAWMQMRGKDRHDRIKEAFKANTFVFAMTRVDSFADGVDKLTNTVDVEKNAAAFSRLFRDGGIFPGILAEKGVVDTLLWNHANLRAHINACSENLVKKSGKTATLPLIEKAQTLCQCRFQNIAYRWSFDEYKNEKLRDGIFAELARVENDRSIDSDCKRFAFGGESK